MKFLSFIFACFSYLALGDEVHQDENVPRKYRDGEIPLALSMVSSPTIIDYGDPLVGKNDDGEKEKDYGNRIRRFLLEDDIERVFDELHNGVADEEDVNNLVRELCNNDPKLELEMQAGVSVGNYSLITQYYLRARDARVLQICQPTPYPTNRPVIYPTNRPAVYPTNRPALYPTNRPFVYPTPFPSLPTSFPVSTTPYPTPFPRLVCTGKTCRHFCIDSNDDCCPGTGYCDGRKCFEGSCIPWANTGCPGKDFSCRPGYKCCGNGCVRSNEPCCLNGRKPCGSGCIGANDNCCSNGRYCSAGTVCCGPTLFPRCIPSGKTCCSNGGYCDASDACCFSLGSYRCFSRRLGGCRIAG